VGILIVVLELKLLLENWKVSDVRMSTIWQHRNNLFRYVAIIELWNISGQPIGLGDITSVKALQVHDMRVCTFEKQEFYRILKIVISTMILDTEVQSCLTISIHVVYLSSSDNES